MYIILKLSWDVSWVFLGCFWGVSGVFLGCFWGVSGVFLGRFFGVSLAFLGRFLGVSWAFLGRFLGVSWAFLGRFLGIYWMIFRLTILFPRKCPHLFRASSITGHSDKTDLPTVLSSEQLLHGMKDRGRPLFLASDESKYVIE
jgi:hypothetical protein